MKILVLVLARKGSKRLKNKNILKINNKSLVARTIHFAKKLPHVTEIMISTDDSRIVKIAEKNQICVPWLRPKKISRDNTTSEKAALHAINWYEKKVEKVNGVLLLQPTSPFRSLSIFKKVIKMYKKNYKKNYVSVSQSNHNSKFYKFKKVLNIKDKKSRKFYKPNGSLYLISPEKLKRQKVFVPKDSIGIFFKNTKYQIDIDNKSDLLHAKNFIKK
jgi:CMP-N-acetylneuraminic acid synthetase